MGCNTLTITWDLNPIYSLFYIYIYIYLLFMERHVHISLRTCLSIAQLYQNSVGSPS